MKGETIEDLKEHIETYQDNLTEELEHLADLTNVLMILLEIAELLEED